MLIDNVKLGGLMKSLNWFQLLLRVIILVGAMMFIAWAICGGKAPAESNSVVVQFPNVNYGER